MKYSILILFLFFTSISSFAKGKKTRQFQTSFTGPDHRWIQSKMRTYPSKDGDVYAQTFTRYIYEVKNPYQLGNISYLSIPFSEKTKGIKSVNEVKEAFEKMFDIRPFNLTNYLGKSNQWVLEGDYKKHGRFIRMIISKHSSRFAFSIAYLRKPYLSSIDLSALWVQDKIIERENKLMKSNVKTTYFSFFPEAYAAPSGNSGLPSEYPCEGPAPLPTTSAETCPSSTSCTPPSPPTPAATAAYQACIQAVSDCRADQLIKVQEALDARIHSVQTDLNCQSEWWASKLDEHSYYWGDKADRGLDLMERVLSPLGIAGLAAGGVVGATIASMGMNLAISGIQQGADALWRLVSGKMAEEKHQEILKLFMDNKEKWDAMNEEAMKLTSKIDSAVDLLEFVQLSGKPLERIILESRGELVNLETQVEDARDSYRSLRDKYRHSPNIPCVNEARENYNQLKFELAKLESDIQKVVDVQQEHGSFDQMCIQLNQNLDKLLEMEGDLQNARVLMLKSYDHFQIEQGRKREDLREAGRDLQLEKPIEAYKEDVERARESFQKGIESSEISNALMRAHRACYEENISKNGWHNFICEVPVFSGIPILGGISDEEEAGMGSACLYYQRKCARIEERKNYLYRIAHNKFRGYSPKQRTELIRAYRQYEGLVDTYQKDLEIAAQTYEQKTKVRDFLHYNEGTAGAKTEALHNWMMSLRLEQACSNVPDSCDDQAFDDMFTKMGTGSAAYNNEIIRKVLVGGKNQVVCTCKHLGVNCNCPEIKKTSYFKCLETKTECDSNRQGLTCYNLPYCPPKSDGSTEHCNEFCPKVIPECTYSDTKTCKSQKLASSLCKEQFQKCAAENLQTGCEMHFTKRCTGSKDFCDDFTKQCREQALNRAKFRFEKIRSQSDLIKRGACKAALR
jgi:hypothetical protein